MATKGSGQPVHLSSLVRAFAAQFETSMDPRLFRGQRVEALTRLSRVIGWAEPSLSEDPFSHGVATCIDVFRCSETIQVMI